MKNKYLPLFLFLILISACNQGVKVNQKMEGLTSENKELIQQAHALFKPVPTLADNPDNPVTTEKISLGKMLYFDTRLSLTGNNSCNSCHNLATFGVDNLPTSKGDNGKFGDRNSPTVLNAALHFTQFWDGRAKDVEEQAGGPILNPAEMAIPSKDYLVNKLKGIPSYVDLFKKAYPGEADPLTYLNVQKSIAAFERTLITPSSFDKFLENDYAALTPAELKGLKTFMDVGCTQCHNGVALGGNMFQKFGVFNDYQNMTGSKSRDEGRKTVTGSATDKDFFKVPSLRNIDKTHPYFHDGSVADLAQAVKIMGKTQLNKDLTAEETNDIVAFLKSLTGEVPESAKTPPAGLAMK